MWKPGNLVTIGGIVYRIMPVTTKVQRYSTPCIDCAFGEMFNCMLGSSQSKYIDCMKLIPENCYFKRVSPIVRWGFNSPSPRGQF